METTSKEVEEETLLKFANLYDRPFVWLTENYGYKDSSNDFAVSPLPDFSSNDQGEFLEFIQVMESKASKLKEAEQIRELSSKYAENSSIEALHYELNTYESSIRTGRVSIFDLLSQLGVVIILRPLTEILGTLLRLECGSGLLLSVYQSKNHLRIASAYARSTPMFATKRDDSVNARAWYKFAAEYLDESYGKKIYNFALDLLLPKHLLAELQKRQKWKDSDLVDPVKMYQASLRLGTNCATTVHAFERMGCFSTADRQKLLNVKLLDVKRTLLVDFKHANIDNIDVWCLSEDKEEFVIKVKKMICLC